MNKFFSQLKKEAQKIRLSPRERDVMRFALEGAMRSRSLLKSPVRITRGHYLLFFPRLAPSLAFVLILAVVGGSTAYAAESAVPGDLLYPIKVSVNEKVTVALAFSSESKAEVHARLMERRMQEAETLAARGTMTAEIKVALEERFDEHTRVVEESVSEVEKEDPVAAADISARLDSSIGAHSAVISRLGRKGNEASPRESRDFAKALRERGKRFAQRGGVFITAERGDSGDISLMAKVSAPEGTSTVAASIVIRDSDEDAITARLMWNASTTLDEARERLKTLKHRLPASTSARLEAQISNIREKIGGSGKDKAEKALKDATTLNVFLEAEAEFEGRELLPPPDPEVESEEDNHSED